MAPNTCILCLEPVGEICLLLGKMLPNTGLKMKHVVNIVDAIEFLRSERPMLLIIDTNFAQHEICRHIATLKEKAPASKILMISAVDEEETTALAAGVDRFLIKPFTKATLTEAVTSMLN